MPNGGARLAHARTGCSSGDPLQSLVPRPVGENGGEGRRPATALLPACGSGEGAPSGRSTSPVHPPTRGFLRNAPHGSSNLLVDPTGGAGPSGGQPECVDQLVGEGGGVGGGEVAAVPVRQHVADDRRAGAVPADP